MSVRGYILICHYRYDTAAVVITGHGLDYWTLFLSYFKLIFTSCLLMVTLLGNVHNYMIEGVSGQYSLHHTVIYDCGQSKNSP